MNAPSDLAMKTDDVLMVELEVFRQEHRDLDEAIHALVERGTGDQLTIQRLHEARVDNACAPAFGIQPFGGLHGLFQPRAIAQQTYTATFTDDAAFANFQRRAARG